MAQYGGYQNRNHSHQHQRYASSPIDYRPQTNPSPARAANFVKQTSSEAGAYQSQHVGRPTNTRHRRYYSADIPSEALPSTVLPTAARARLQYTAGISASQSRHQPQTQTQARARQVLQQGEWESLRQRGYVLRGTADINIHTATAPSVVSTPSQASHSSSIQSSSRRSHRSGTSFKKRQSHGPFYHVQPGIRTTFHPGAFPTPFNHFMRPADRALAPIPRSSVRQDMPPIQQAVRFDNVFPQQHQIMYPASVPSVSVSGEQNPHSTTMSPNQPPTPIARFKPSSTQKHIRPPPTANVHFRETIRVIPHTTGPSSPLILQNSQNDRLLFDERVPSRPFSPLRAQPVPNAGILHSSTSLRRQETDQSLYSQLTFPEAYLPATGEATVGSQKPDVERLWEDLEKELMGSPSLHSPDGMLLQSSLIGGPSELTYTQGDEEEDAGKTYDFTQNDVTSAPGKSITSPMEQSTANWIGARPLLLRRHAGSPERSDSRPICDTENAPPIKSWQDFVNDSTAQDDDPNPDDRDLDDVVANVLLGGRPQLASLVRAHPSKKPGILVSIHTSPTRPVGGASSKRVRQASLIPSPTRRTFEGKVYSSRDESSKKRLPFSQV